VLHDGRVLDRAVRRHARAAHRRYRLFQDRLGVRRGGRDPPHRGGDRRGRARLGCSRWSRTRLRRGFFQAKGAALKDKLKAEREEKRALEKELARLKSKLVASQGEDLAAQAVDVKRRQGACRHARGGLTPRPWRETMDRLKHPAQVGGDRPRLGRRRQGIADRRGDGPISRQK